MTFQVFKKIVTRDTANKLIAQDFINQLVHGGDQEAIFDILIDGSAGIEKWSDENVAEYLQALLAENYTAEQLKEMGIL